LAIKDINISANKLSLRWIGRQSGKKMEKSKINIKGGRWLLVAGFALLMSLPFLVPHLGFL
jgi:hypothetical protein